LNLGRGQRVGIEWEIKEVAFMLNSVEYSCPEVLAGECRIRHSTCLSIHCCQKARKDAETGMTWLREMISKGSFTRMAISAQSSFGSVEVGGAPFPESTGIEGGIIDGGGQEQS